MNEAILAKRYINALCDATPKESLDDTLDSLLQIIDTLKGQSKFWSALTNPKLSYEQKLKFVTGVLTGFEPNQYVTNFIRLLLQKKRLNILKYSQAVVVLQLERIRNVVTADVFAPVAFDTNTLEDLRHYLSGLVNKTVQINFVKDEDILGGFKVKIGNVIYDATLNNAIQQFKSRIY
jgi:F-type H+-transporting ATPase subunit delta